MKTRVLVVDDERTIVDIVQSMLELENIGAEVASDCEGAVALLAGFFYPVIVTDLRLNSEEEGLRFIDAVREYAPRSRVIVLSGHATPEMERDLLSRGVSLVLHKPAAGDVLLDAVNALLDEFGRETGDGEVNLEKLYLTVRTKLLSIPRKRFGLSQQAAEDVLHDAWLLFLHKRGLIREPGPWLSGTVANLSRQQIDRRVRKRETSVEVLATMADRSGGSITDVIAIREALAQTEDRTRMLCSMIGMDGQSYEEVSAATGIPIGSIGPLYIRAKTKVRNILTN